jgi:hypothetical protein
MGTDCPILSDGGAIMLKNVTSENRSKAQSGKRLLDTGILVTNQTPTAGVSDFAEVKQNLQSLVGKDSKQSSFRILKVGESFRIWQVRFAILNLIR